jgi:uncharacterized Fe-S cluster protein YjdI
MSESNQRQYSNGEITVVWQPEVCIHSKLCWKGLLNVFNPQKRPWVNIDGASTEEIREQVSKCPSGALSYFDNDVHTAATSIQSERIVEVVPDGPLLVYGHVQVKDASGHTVDKHKVTAFCRCGASSNKPYCDGTHRKIDFKG